MFSAKGFVVGTNVTRSSGSAAAAITANSIAATIAATKPAEHSVELQTFATERLRKEDWINGTDSERIVGGGPHFPLWIKVPSII
jgi:hypothetical protein